MELETETHPILTVTWPKMSTKRKEPLYQSWLTAHAPGVSSNAPSTIQKKTKLKDSRSQQFDRIAEMIVKGILSPHGPPISHTLPAKAINICV